MVNESKLWQYDLLFSTAPQNWLIHFLVLSLTTIVLTSLGLTNTIFAWYVAMTLFTALLAGLAIAYRYTKPETEKAVIYGWIHFSLTGIVGLGWGIGAHLVSLNNADALIFFTFALGGTALGAVSFQHPRLPDCLVSIWTSMPLLALAHAFSIHGIGAIATGGIILLFGLTLTTMAIRAHRFLADGEKSRQHLAAQNQHLEKVTAELQAAQNVRLRFLAQASHDVRQPVHAIGLFIECLKGMRLNHEGDELLSRIDNSLSTLSRLCQSLLDVSALDAGQIKPNLSNVAIEDIVGDVLRQAEETARNRHVQLRHVESRRWVRTDPGLLHNMLQNLVSNAIKYAPNKPILIGPRLIGEHIAIDVVDQGSGLSTDEQKLIFDEFIRLDAPDGHQEEGLGLGLSIVRRLAETLTLKLELCSIEGRGSRFRISGLQPVDAEIFSENRHSISYERQLEGTQVLVIDNDVDVLESTTNVLSRWGCTVRAFEKCPCFSDIDQTDFIFCDQDLDDQSGLDIIRQIRVQSEQNSPAAIVTGSNSQQIIRHAEKEGIHILRKPVRPAQLRSVLLAARAKNHR